jgi:ABC-type bacteriocin/lantibiotic exporter with double-glycine peptidase domain
MLLSLAASQAASVRLEVPNIKQPYNLCMVASVSMVLQYWDLEIAPEKIAERVPVYKEGTTGKDLLAFVESIGCRGFLIQPKLEDIFQHLGKGRPLIVTLPGRGQLRHAMVVTGYDEAFVWLNDPASGKPRKQSIESFQSNWEKTDRWTFLILPR